MARGGGAASASSEVDLLREKAELLRASIRRSKALRDEAAAALSSMSAHKAAVDEAILPAKSKILSSFVTHDNVRRSTRAVEAIVRHLDRVQQAEREISSTPGNGVNNYLDAVDKLRSAHRFFTCKRSGQAGGDALRRFGELLPAAAALLEEDFQRLLSKCSKPVELELLVGHQSTSSSKEASQDELNPDAAAQSLPALVDPCYVPLLAKLVQKSFQLGRHKQFLKIYRDARSSAMELTLKNMRVERVGKEQVQALQPESLDDETCRWIGSFRVAVKVLFNAERVLCDQVFAAKFTSWKDRCFAVITEKCLSVLLSFGEAVARTPASEKRLFVLMDLHQAIFELQPEVEAVFQGNACSGNRKSVLSLAKFLAETAKGVLGVFKQNIVSDSPKSITTDGAVHPLTSYVMKYVDFLDGYRPSLKQIFQESNTGDKTTCDLFPEITDLVQALETNLDAKSKQFNNQALGNLFHMNNIHYIISYICRSDFKELFGDDWIQRRRRSVKRHATQYIRVAWGKVLEPLSAHGLTSSDRPVRGCIQGSAGNIRSCKVTASRSAIKTRFMSFNMQFEEACQAQMNWAVPDTELHDELILAITEIMLPAYRSFLGLFRHLVEKSQSASKYIKYTPEGLEQALGNIFAKKLNMACEIRIPGITLEAINCTK